MIHSSVPGAVIFDMDNTLHSLHAAAQAAADAVSLFFGTEYNLHFTPLNRDRPSMPAEFREYFGDEKIAAEAFYMYYKLELLCLREFDGKGCRHSSCNSLKLGWTLGLSKTFINGS